MLRHPSFKGMVSGDQAGDLRMRIFRRTRRSQHSRQKPIGVRWCTEIGRCVCDLEAKRGFRQEIYPADAALPRNPGDPALVTCGRALAVEVAAVDVVFHGTSPWAVAATQKGWSPPCVAWDTVPVHTAPRSPATARPGTASTSFVLMGFASAVGPQPVLPRLHGKSVCFFAIVPLHLCLAYIEAP
jgi:hypothetical protein